MGCQLKSLSSALRDGKQLSKPKPRQPPGIVNFPCDV